tara:strand:- start:1135 stop:1413 length:279 start_codon:yes stop_codon:yes gene_type:complete
MTTNKTLTQHLIFYSDPKHAWLKTSLEDLKKLKIENKVSTYSYINGDHVYLEEDCDATLYLNTLKDYGIDYLIEDNYCNNDSIIRTYNRYKQ